MVRVVKKVISILSLAIVLTLICTGCEEEKKVAKESNYNVLHCTRKSTTQDNLTTSLKYSIYYDNLYVTKTVSVEKVTSSSDDLLEKYKTAYENVFANYKGIPYYNNTVEKVGDTVTSTTIIDYEHLDYKKILEIEGEDGNIFESDGKVKKKTLVSLYKKYGAKCE